CFSVNVFAGNIMLCMDMPQQESQQQPDDMVNNDCHFEKSTQDEAYDCCQDMTSCNGTLLYIADVVATSLLTRHHFIALPLYEDTLLKFSSPPTPPPKSFS
ncbi:MAG: hypothetical protein MI865_12005, partial [Proteobacteria bacterium]|nr:hypothetical protein [Pseudomonadota bacterium]